MVSGFTRKKLTAKIRNPQSAKAACPAFAGLVRRERPRPAVAAHARSLRHLGFRNHAATDAGENGHSVWNRWLRELPTIEAAAKASRVKIHKLWEGLGYYTRVRNLQKAAQVNREKRKAWRQIS
jgi:hypothetical protein